MIYTSQTIKQNFTEGLWREGQKGGLDGAPFHRMSLKKYFLKIPFPMTTVNHLFPLSMSKLLSKTFLVVQCLRFHVPNAAGLGSIPNQGARSHMPQLRPGTAE